MKIKELLTELGKFTYPYKVTRRTKDLVIIESDEGGIELFLTKLAPNNIVIEFHVGGRFELIGSGKAIPILSTVKNMLQEELPKFIDNKTNTISFGAEKSEPSRIRFYNQKVVSVINSILGPHWKYEPDVGGTDFSIKIYSWKRKD